MQLAFRYDTVVVQFEVIFRKRKSMTIIVEAPDKVIAIVPIRTGQAIILEKVQAKAPWIIKKLEYFRNVQQLHTPREFADGESFLYLGEDYQLQVEHDISLGRPEVKFKQGRLCICTPTIDKITLASALGGWYRQRAKEIIPGRVNYYQYKIPKEPNRIVIKDQKKRWGSCSSKGNLNFNWRIVMAPVAVMDYIVVHEMCHLVHLNHSKEFWNLVAEILPDYKDVQKWLKINGVRLSL
ncbi:MAG: M48 family peptidase [Firmicutes bacterium HGW-Firmicutes-15]|nr:MAG: M48 family peptidase [Firmicutes bacterium HGW-Firmicutes-15]